MPGPLTRPFRPPRLRLSRASVCEGGSAHRVLTFLGGERRGSSPSLFLGGWVGGQRPRPPPQDGEKEGYAREMDFEAGPYYPRDRYHCLRLGLPDRFRASGAELSALVGRVGASRRGREKKVPHPQL